MKKLILLVLILSLQFINCYEDIEDPPFSGIKIIYSGDYFIFFYNTDINGIKKLYIAERTGSYTWNKEDVEYYIGKLYTFNFTIIKTAGAEYQDEGLLTFTIIEKNSILFKVEMEHKVIELNDGFVFQ